MSNEISATEIATETLTEVVAAPAAEETQPNVFVRFFIAKDNLAVKLIFFIGILTAFVTGLLFVLLGDLLLNCESTWLIGAIIFTFGSGVFAVLSGMYKEKLVLKYLFKGLALAFIFAFLGLIIGFYLNKAASVGNALKGANSATFIVTVILTAVTALCQVGDLALAITIKEK